MVRFEEVSVTLGGHAAVRDLSLEVAAGETLVLLGRSGSGKTSTLKLINRLLLPDRGTVLVEGIPTTSWDPIRLRRGIGYVIQEVGLFPHLTIARNVGLVPKLERWKASRVNGRVKELLELVGLDPAEYADRYPAQLSGGERQRVGVARALAADPPMLLMDEPFGALDPITRAELQKVFLDLQAKLKKTVVMVTHDVQESLLLASRIGLMEAGRLIELAEPQDFRTSSSPLAEAFLRVLDPKLGCDPGASW
jgi:osmoprotectant transport system ATP-binding protein